MSEKKRGNARGVRAEIFWCEGEAKLRAKGTTRMIGAQKPLVPKKEKASDQYVNRGKIITHQDSSNWKVGRCDSLEARGEVVMREKRRPAAMRQKKPARLRHHPSCLMRYSPRSRHIKQGW